MRIIIYSIGLVLSCYITSFATANGFICSENEKSSVAEFNNEQLVIKCDCNCTNEENKFYFVSNKTKVASSIEASRLLSSKGLDLKTFSKLKNKKRICPRVEYLPSYASSFIFGLKEPLNSGSGTCFSILDSQEIVAIESNQPPILYKVNKSLPYPLNTALSISDKLEKRGLYELSNKNFSQDENISTINLAKGSLVYGLAKTITPEGIAIIQSLYKTEEGTFILQIPEENLVNKTVLSYTVNSKAWLFKAGSEGSKTKMYLIKGDKVTILDEKTNDSNQKWYFINYKGKKDLNMWIKAEAIDIPESKDIPKKEKPVSEKVSKIPQPSTSILNTVAIKEENIEVTIPKGKVSTTSADKIIVAQTKQEKKASGSVSLSLIASLLGLFAFRFS